MLMILRQLPHNAVLRKICVLIFIHQHISESLFPFLQHVGIALKQQIGVEQNVIEVHRITLATPVAVALENLTQHRHVMPCIRLPVSRVSHILLSSHQLVLGIADNTLHVTWLIRLIIQFHLLDDGLDKTLAV